MKWKVLLFVSVLTASVLLCAEAGPAKNRKKNRNDDDREPAAANNNENAQTDVEGGQSVGEGNRRESQSGGGGNNEDRERTESKKKEEESKSEEEDEDETTVEPTTEAVARRAGTFLRAKRRKTRPLDTVNPAVVHNHDATAPRHHGQGSRQKPHIQKKIKAKITQEGFKERISRYMRMALFA